MPRMHHPKTGHTTNAPDRHVAALLAQGWQREGSEPAEPERPAVSASKDEWEAYAESQGVDVDGLTKAEIVDSV